MANLSGIIREDMTFHNGEVVTVSGTVQVAEGVTLTWEPGSKLIGDTNQSYNEFEIFGSIVLSGTSDSFVSSENVSFRGKGGDLKIEYSHIDRASIFPTFYNYGLLEIKNSVIKNTGGIDVDSLKEGSVLESNILSNSNIEYTQGWEFNINNNTFINGSYIDTTAWFSFGGKGLGLNGNNFLSSDLVLELKSMTGDEHRINTSGNYWGTSSPDEIGLKVIDGNDDLNIKGVVDLSQRSESFSATAPLSLGDYRVNEETFLLEKIEGPNVSPPSSIEGSNISTVETVSDIGRLYKAAFNRSPDVEGLNYWIDQWEGGMDILSISQSFYQSAEFKSMYGEPDDSAYIDLIYQNVLGRPADESGKDYWLNEISSGTTRSGILNSFSDSQENIDNTDDLFSYLREAADGYWIM